MMYMNRTVTRKKIEGVLASVNLRLSYRKSDKSIIPCSVIKEQPLYCMIVCEVCGLNTIDLFF